MTRRRLALEMLSTRVNEGDGDDDDDDDDDADVKIEHGYDVMQPYRGF